MQALQYLLASDIKIQYVVYIMCIHIFIYILIYIWINIYIYSSTQGCKAGARKDCKHKIAECASQQLFSLRFLGKEKRIQELNHWKKQCSILIHWFRDPEVLEVFERTVYQRLRTCGQKVQMWCGILSFRKPRSLRVYSCPKRLGPELYKRLGRCRFTGRWEAKARDPNRLVTSHTPILGCQAKMSLALDDTIWSMENTQQKSIPGQQKHSFCHCLALQVSFPQLSQPLLSAARDLNRLRLAIWSANACIVLFGSCV